MVIILSELHIMGSIRSDLWVPWCINHTYSTADLSERLHLSLIAGGFFAWWEDVLCFLPKKYVICKSEKVSKGANISSAQTVALFPF